MSYKHINPVVFKGNADLKLVLNFRFNENPGEISIEVWKDNTSIGGQNHRIGQVNNVSISDIKFELKRLLQKL